MPVKIKTLNYFASFDLFGVAPTLSFKNGGKSKTIYGSMLSYAMIGWIIMSFLYSFENMVLHKNPSSFTSIVGGRIKGVNYGKDKMHIGISLFNPNTG